MCNLVRMKGSKASAKLAAPGTKVGKGAVRTTMNQPFGGGRGKRGGRAKGKR